MKDYQEMVDRICNYMEENGFMLSPEKTTMMAFTRQRSLRQEFKLLIANKPIVTSKSTKFLGVIIQENLKWTNHVKHLSTKALRATNLIKMIKYEPWATPKILVHLVKTLIRSRLTYGIEAFFTASKTNWDLLGRIERKALKCALNLPQSTKTFLLYQEIGWMPLEFTAKMNCAKFEASSYASKNCVKAK